MTAAPFFIGKNKGHGTQADRFESPESKLPSTLDDSLNRREGSPNERIIRSTSTYPLVVLYARDIVEKDFLSVSADATVLEVAKAMKNSKHGFAIIGSPNDPRGIVTEWDIICKVVSEGGDPQKVTMGEIMTLNLLSIDAGAPLSDVSQIMTEKGIRRLLVKDGAMVVGYITSKTMLARMNDYVDKVSAQISRLQTPQM